MVSTLQISQWASRPELLLQEEESLLQQLIQDYPYFSLGHLMLNYQKVQNTVNRDLYEIFGYNPVIYYYWNTPGNEATTTAEHISFDLPAMDYFSQQGIPVSNEIPEIIFNREKKKETEEDKSLLVVMSFAEWLSFLQQKTRKETEEAQEQSALKAMWQKQKMTEAIEEENDEIPEDVFEMAVNSIQREDEGIVSESMATIYAKQGKISQAIEVYKKLSLHNPEKSVYFAQKIESLQKEI